MPEVGYKKRPTKKMIRRIVDWLEEQGISLYAQNCDVETGIKYLSQMDVKSVEQIIGIYEHNKNDTWIEHNDT